MNTILISDHIQRAKDRLLEQYKNKPNLSGLIQGFVQQIQDLENIFQDLAVDRWIDSSEGIQLDRIGFIVGLSREVGLSDGDYVLLIKSKIIQNLNQGTPEEIIAAAKFFIGTSFIWYLEVYPAAVDILSTVVIAPADRQKIRAQLQSFLPAGVSLDTFGQYDLSNAFRFNTGAGFGDVNNPITGALLANAY